MSTLRADVWFDLVCPWCAIGKRHFERALEMLAREEPALEVDLRWHGVQLLPEIPPAGVPYAEFYARRLGSPEAVRRRQAEVREAAARAGQSIAFERIRTMPNTGAAHRLLAWVAEREGAATHALLLQRVLDASFVEGEDIGDRGTLARIALRCGVDSLRLAQCRDEPLRSVPMPVGSGVPLFVFGERLAVSGAQPPEALLAAMRKTIDPDAGSKDTTP
jgi:predicted DsbA family dithiol-disulfide isomerase